MREPAPKILLQNDNEIDKAYNAGSAKQAPSSPQLYFPSWKRPFNGLKFSIHTLETEVCHMPSGLDWWSENRLAFDAIRAHTANKDKISPGAGLFWTYIETAQTDVMFLDSHLQDFEVRRILLALSEREKRHDPNPICVRIISVFSEQSEESVVKAIEEHNFKYSTLEVFSYGKDLSDWIHDRFALIGDQMWHFGAKVGAMHKGINAFSGPWSDSGASMQTLLFSIQKKCHQIYPTSSKFLAQLRCFPRRVKTH